MSEHAEPSLDYLHKPLAPILYPMQHVIIDYFMFIAITVLLISHFMKEPQGVRKTIREADLHVFL